MARTIAEIQEQMYDELADQQAAGNLTGLTSTSKVAIYKLWIYIVSVAISVFENLQDVFRTELEDYAKTVAPATHAWIRAKVFEFQYGDSIQLIDLVPKYATIDTSKQIVTRCSVKTSNQQKVIVKVAKSDPPVALATLEETALGAYLDAILPAGVQLSLVNRTSDKLYINASVYYNGQYAVTIKADVIASINNYLSSLPFDGVVKVSAIEDAIQKVTGVTDIVINQVKARPDSTSFSSASVVTRYWDTVAGYIVEEDTSGQTFSDTLTFTVANN